MTSLPAFELPQQPEPRLLTPAQQVAEAIAEIAEITSALESGALTPSAQTVIRLQQATASLELLVARLP
jgi:hypothetical protein